MRNSLNCCWSVIFVLAFFNIQPANAWQDAAQDETAELEEGFVDSAGVKIHYVTAGQGPLLVMIHAPLAAADFESASRLKASEILSQNLLRSDLHQVAEEVANDGYMNTYLVQS